MEDTSSARGTEERHRITSEHRGADPTGDPAIRRGRDRTGGQAVKERVSSSSSENSPWSSPSTEMMSVSGRPGQLKCTQPSLSVNSDTAPLKIPMLLTPTRADFFCC